MMNIISFFQKHSKPVIVEGNKPLLLSDPNSVWLVKSGKVTVFCTPVNSDGITGARDFLFEALAGEILLGLSPVETTGRMNMFCLLAAGLPGTELWQIPVELLFQQLNQPSGRSALIPLLEQWIKSLAKGVNLAGAPAVQLYPDSIEPVRVQLEDNIAPLTLVDFHRQALLAAINNRKVREEEQRQRLQKSLEINRLYMENAIKEIASVAQPGLKDSGGEQISGDPLFKACSLVGQAMQIKIIYSSRARNSKPAKDPLGDIARASRIRIRQVALKGDWYHQDNGPLLAYMKEDNRPVALIPVTPTLYKLHDPTNNTTAPVDAKTARQLKPFGIAFYRPFPQKALQLKDILTFGYQGSWKQDLWIIILMGLAGGILSMAIPYATGIIFDTIIPGGEKAQLLQVAFFLGAAALAGLLFQLTRSMALLRLEGKMEGSIQPAIWDRLLSLPVPFFKDYNAGELAMRAMGVSEIRMMLSGLVVNDIISSFFSLFNLGLMFYYHVKLAAISSLVIMLAVFFMVLLGYRQVNYERQVLDITNRISGLMLQLLSGITKFKVAGAENKAFHLITRSFSEQCFWVLHLQAARPGGKGRP